MPMPSLVYQGTAAVSGTGAISVTRPTGILQAGDVELLFIETAIQAVTAPSGWSQAPGSPLGVGTAGATTATRLTILWRYSAGETTAISIADPGDHIIAYYMAFRDCDQTSPFYNNPNTFTFSSSTAGTFFEIADQTIAPLANNLVYIMALANQYDSSSPTTVYAGIGGGYDPEYYPDGDGVLWQTSSGNGGGLSISWDFCAESNTHAVLGYEIYSAVNIYPCAIWLLLQGNQSNDKTGSASFSHTSSVTATADGSGLQDTCPFVYATGPVAEGTGAVTVLYCTNRYDGGTITVNDEWDNKLELLVVETAAQSVSIDGFGWQAVPNTPISTGTAGRTSSTGLYVFWRIHPENWGDSVYIADPGDHVVARRFIIANADVTEPILTVCYCDPATGNYSDSIQPNKGGNATDSFADLGYIISSSGMFSVLGLCSWATDSATRAFSLNEDPPYDPIYYTTEGPEFSTDTWNIIPSPLPFETGTTQGNGGGFHAWIGKRYLNTTDSGNTYQDRGRIQPPGIGSYVSMQYRCVLNCIQSTAAPPSLSRPANITVSSSVSATYQWSTQESAGVASILYTATVTASVQRSPEVYKSADIQHISSLTASWARIQGGPFLVEYAHSLIAPSFKNANLLAQLFLNSQAVPVSKQGAIALVGFSLIIRICAWIQEVDGDRVWIWHFAVSSPLFLRTTGSRTIVRSAII
jgi:hypothetical protein